MKPISRDWTAEDRLRVIAALLPSMQLDIYAGNYSKPGRPNITTLQHIIYEEPADLEPYRATVEAAVAKHEAELG
jgi:hypothetical protein